MNATLLERKESSPRWKNGYVQCACGWRKRLGDGFDGYHIDFCPNCNSEIDTRIQSTVTVGRPGNYEIKHGHYRYFVIKDAIHVQFDGVTYHTEHRQSLPRTR